MQKRIKQPKHAGGRPSVYRASYPDLAYKYCLLGATDDDLALFFEVNQLTINRWKLKHPQFCKALKEGKAQADAVVAEKLFRRACGYSHPDVDIKQFDGKIIVTDILKHYPPDTTAAIFWLKNRQKEKWRDVQRLEHTDKDGGSVMEPLALAIAQHLARKP